ncbi:MAG: TetR/AcrR family transcriptional regulator [Desulfobacterales bacterium]|nr:TetR/AcrR family transcriptional regulator [Desulfobacterales bacterium]
MKISAQQKEETRRNIIAAAVDLMTARGFKAATMREIARSAGVGDATIYNYFPTKDAILYAYYQDHVEIWIKRLRAREDFHELTLAEQLQSAFETSLELYLPDREFVAESFKILFLALGQNYRHMQPVRERFGDMIRDLFEAAVEAEEIPDQMFAEMVYLVFWDYYIGLVFYWLHDTSDGFANTSILIDKSLDLAIAFISSGTMNKLFDLGLFMFRQHVLHRMEFFKARAAGLQKVKRKFRGDPDGGQDTEK